MRFVCCALVGATIWYATVANSATLETVKDRDELRCGVHGERPGFSALDSAGHLVGLDIDICRAVAAAVLEDSDKVKFVTAAEQDARFRMLRSGVVDMLDSATASVARDTAQGLEFPVITFFPPPMGPVVRDGDDQWEAIIRWVVHALILADELGLTTAKIDGQPSNPKPAVQGLLGNRNVGQELGLDALWARRAITAGGNYGEIVARHWPNDNLGLTRSFNRPWTNGGLMIAPLLE